MKNPVKTVVYDHTLRLEAYYFAGIAQPFPNHFHEYYVIGLVEQGQRRLSCRGQEAVLSPGDMLLLHPGDNHACAQTGDEPLYYRSIAVSIPVMEDYMERLTGTPGLPRFSQNVIAQAAAAPCFRRLHQLLLTGSDSPSKAAMPLPLLAQLRAECGASAADPPCPDEILLACRWMEQHYAQHISLRQLCRHTGLSQSTLLRTFTRAKGVTPYRYLENIRISRARALLEQGASPMEAALLTGFSDQSHFTNCFSRLIGLPPGAYREIYTEKQKDGAT